MRKLILTAFLIFIFAGLSFSQVRIGWHQSSIEIDAGVTDQKVFVVLENKYAPNTYGVWPYTTYHRIL